LSTKSIILIIPNFGTGGAQRSFSNLSNELNKQFRVINVVFNLDRPLVYPLDGSLINLDVGGGGSVYKKVKNFFLRVARLREIKKQYGVTTAISFLEGADYVNVLSKRKDKVVLSIRGSKLHDGNISGLVGFLRKKILIPLLYRRADEIVVVNKGIARELNESFGLKRISKIVINNFYDAEKIRQLGKMPLPDEFDWLLNQRYIVISSRLAREKNILTLISVFAGLRKRGFDGKMVIVGDGPEALNIDAHCRALYLRKYQDGDIDHSAIDVVCVGADDNPYKYVKGALCFVMASESEGFPNALVEAMILGVPVISSDCPWGPREVLEPGMEINQNFVTEPLKARLGILMPQLTDTVGSVNLWTEYLYHLLQDEACLQHYAEEGTRGANVYTKTKSINDWLAVVNKI
jgi:glycosyltransferase involved in cell wall biosynthesis